MNWLEPLATLITVVCVWMVVKESVWNFPLGILSNILFGVVVWNSRLYADAGLQVVYIGLAIYGWMQWLYGSYNFRPLSIAEMPRKYVPRLILAAVIMALLMAWALAHYPDAKFPYWHSTATAVSLVAQWLLSKKYLESWYVWMSVDVVYVGIYYASGLYYFSALYFVFIIMAAAGLAEWKRRFQRETAGAVALQPVQA